ncbi:hypothetical protein ND748_01045 [Frankia sp. AiPs1]|uniref:hypothetical protein n=1 Tax=Frankia sp. AiPs1 TaxID=573493 RepID=UPI002044A94A|nr:hypothetical protein [Frankia sp. AiPs1]MCM3920275.1 hypothetical protein [Frankia sp. AiPs1]
MLHAVAARLLLLHLTLTDAYRRSRNRADARDHGDAGLSTAVIAVGLVLIAGVVILYLRQKATQIASNVCTSTDPTQCQQQ